MFAAEDLLDLGQTDHGSFFRSADPAWTILSGIKGYLSANLNPELRGDVAQGAHVGPEVFLDEGSVVEPGATIKGPAWIGKNCVVRSGAYIRENVIAGDGVMMGNSCEFKNCLLFNGCEVPHFNYVGDSILGYRAHLGAGVILSNVRLDRNPVKVRSAQGEMLDSGLVKFGAIVGDFAEIGCNSVLSPGSIIGRNCILYPGTQWRGSLPDNRIVKLIQQQEILERR